MANEDVLTGRWDDLFHDTGEYQGALKEAAMGRARGDQENQDAIQQALMAGDTRRAGMLNNQRGMRDAQPNPTVAGLDAYQKGREQTFIDRTKQSRMQDFQKNGGYVGAPSPQSAQNPDFSTTLPWMHVDRPIRFHGGQDPKQAADERARLDPGSMSPEQAATMSPAQRQELQHPDQSAMLAQTAQQAAFDTGTRLQGAENNLRQSLSRSKKDQDSFSAVWPNLTPSEKIFILRQPPERQADMVRSHPLRNAPRSVGSILAPYQGAMGSAENDIFSQSLNEMGAGAYPSISPAGRPSASLADVGSVANSY